MTGLVPHPPSHLLDLCQIGEWAEQRLRLKVKRLARCARGRAIGQGRRAALWRRAIRQGRREAPRRRAMWRRRRGTPRQRRIGGPLRVLVVRLLGLTVGTRRRVLRWRGGKLRVPVHVRGRPIPGGSLHNA